jgi:hypothetical protein
MNFLKHDVLYVRLSVIVGLVWAAVTDTHYVSRIVIWPYLIVVVARRRGQGQSEQPTVDFLYKPERSVLYVY